ncbi:FecR domain-containing protein [Brevundimonas guildfordensis]|uniref:FecR domain-containing protein n=1 Tax=Brevundimonas guildfordensis TaxID=2762241 RepID=A0ABR8QZR8_9CAUL|nr:FecR domain-containing protein [Brevundimonas guildfordensis]MBD7940747.1 FecR domain-containing protein [Brevundimonas guildfordensis]
MKSNWSCVLAAAVLLSASPALGQSTAPSRPTETLDYVVRRGDTLFDLATAYMNRPLDYRRVQRENRVVNPRRLAIGRTLALPVDLLRADPDQARIAGFRGAVTLHQDGVAAAPTAGQIVRESAVLSTGPNAFVRLALSDGSHVVVPSNSRVRVSRLRRYAINGAVDHALTVEAGRAESKVTPRTRPGGFAIRTPVSVSAVRGTDFRVSFDEASARSATEVLEGAVVVAAGEAGTLAAADQGVSVAVGAVLLLPLLPAPALARPDAPQTRAQVVFEVEPLAGAERYRGRVAQDAGMVESFAEADSAPGGPLMFGEMEEGAYFLRLTALSPEGLEGKATTYSFIRARNGVGGLASAMERRERRRFYRFRWEAEGVGQAAFRFQLWGEAEDGGVDGPMLIDQPGLTDEAFTLSDLPPGVYNWRVQSARHRFGRLLEAWSEPQQLRIGR